MNTVRMDTHMHIETRGHTQSGLKRPENVLSGSVSMCEAVGVIPVLKRKKGKK